VSRCSSGELKTISRARIKRKKLKNEVFWISPLINALLSINQLKMNNL
jgi:hypothetical protein